jgi:hypothetical protein
VSGSPWSEYRIYFWLQPRSFVSHRRRMRAERNRMLHVSYSKNRGGQSPLSTADTNRGMAYLHQTPDETIGFRGSLLPRT